MKDMTDEELVEYETSIDEIFKHTNINIYDLIKENNIMSYKETHDIFLVSSKNNSIHLDKLKQSIEVFKYNKDELNINKIYVKLLNPNKQWDEYLDYCLKLIDEKETYNETFNEYYKNRIDLMNFTDEQKKIYILENFHKEYIEESMFFPEDITKEYVEHNYIYYIDIHTSDDLPDKEIDYLYWLVIGIFFKDNTIINNVSYSI